MILASYRVHLALCSRRTPHFAWRYYSTPVDIPVPTKSKVWVSADEAVKDIKSGSVVLSGGLFDVVFTLTFQSSHHSRLWTVWHTGSVLPKFSSLHCNNRHFVPDTLIQAIAKRPEIQNLTAVSNNAGVGERGLGEYPICVSLLPG